MMDYIIPQTKHSIYIWSAWLEQASLHASGDPITRRHKISVAERDSQDLATTRQLSRNTVYFSRPLHMVS
jgi:hypothetical protein